MSKKLRLLKRVLKSRECVSFVMCELRLKIQLRTALLSPHSITKVVSHIVLLSAQNGHVWPDSLVTLALLTTLDLNVFAFVISLGSFRYHYTNRSVDF